MENYSISDNAAKNRFETESDGITAFMEYAKDDKFISLLHTEVPDEIGGKGIANALAEYSFKYAQENGLKVKVYCPFVAVYVKRHPELQPLVKEKENK